MSEIDVSSAAMTDLLLSLDAVFQRQSLSTKQAAAALAVLEITVVLLALPDASDAELRSIRLDNDVDAIIRNARNIARCMFPSIDVRPVLQ